ncbi:MAG: PVC-type heme-binding CxxCH protein, partial [Planctomycetota bacterium]
MKRMRALLSRHGCDRHTFIIKAWIALGWVFGWLVAQPIAAWSDDLLPARTPPIEADRSVEAMQVANGFTVELAAAEPHIGTPVDVCWDERGRMYVCEMRGYSEQRDERLSRISRLEDRDQDGFYESSSVFASGLLWPTAVIAYRDGLFVADAPHIYFFRDTDDDGRADAKTIVLTGFGTQNVQGLLNSLRWGLDNRIHVACSSNGGNVSLFGQPDSALSVRGHDLAFDPETYSFERTSGGAQNGMCFDDWGRKYVSSNSDHIQQVVYRQSSLPTSHRGTLPSARASIAADGPQAEVFRRSPVEPWRVVRTRLRVSGLVPGPVEGGGRPAGYFTGATGVTIYRGDAWPEKYRGLAFIGDVGSNLVHRKRIEAVGVQRVAHRIDVQSEFIASTDNWFRPAQFACGPDGNLYVVDVCREVIEHPKSLPPEIKRQVDLTSGRDRGRVYRVLADGVNQRSGRDLFARSTDELVRTLAHPNAWHRETAARLLYQRQDTAAIELLKRLASQSSSPLGRLHALHALDGLSSLDRSQLRAALADRHPEIRRHAIQLATEHQQFRLIVDAMPSLMTDSSADVLFELLLAMPTLQMREKATILAKLTQGAPNDRWLRMAVQLASADVAADLFSILISDSTYVGDGAESLLHSLASQIGRRNDTKAVAASLQALHDAPVRPASQALPLIGTLLSGAGKTWPAAVTQLPAKSRESLEALVLRLETQLLRFAVDDHKPSDERVLAIHALGQGPTDRSDSDLSRLLGGNAPLPVQQAVVTTLSSRSTKDSIRRVLDAWPQLVPSLRREVIQRLWVYSVGRESIIDLIEAGDIAEMEITRADWADAAKSRDQRVREFAQAVLRRNQAVPRQQVIADYQEALTRSGDPRPGRKVFRRVCSSCHRFGDEGQERGPNLAAFAVRGGPSLLVNVLDPNREVNPQYLRYTVLMVDGQVLSGMIVSEGSNGLTLFDQNGRETQ